MAEVTKREERHEHHVRLALSSTFLTQDNIGMRWLTISLAPFCISCQLTFFPKNISDFFIGQTTYRLHNISGTMRFVFRIDDIEIQGNSDPKIKSNQSSSISSMVGVHTSTCGENIQLRRNRMAPILDQEAKFLCSPVFGVVLHD